MERVLALAALVRAGFDVLQSDASVVFVRDFLPLLVGAPEGVDMLVQRDGGPAAAAKQLGSAVCTGFAFVRSIAAKREAVVRFLLDVVRRGLVEFYNRWNNIVDQQGWSFIVADSRSSPHTSQLANETTLMTIERHGCAPEACLRLGFLPYDQFPRIGSWPALRSTAAIYHLVPDGSLGPQFEAPVGVKPFRGHRQRLDRYDEVDFDGFRDVMREMGLWLVDGAHQRLQL